MKPLSLEKFRQLVESYGARPSRWPERERAAAVALLGISSEARALCRAEEPLDRALDEYEVPSLPVAFERRLNELPIRVPRKSRWRGRALGASLVAWAAAALFGLWLGNVVPEEIEADASEDTQGVLVPASDDAVSELASSSFVDLEDAQ